MSVASYMLLLQVATSRAVYSGEALSFGGGQSPMPDGDDENNILVALFCLTAAAFTLSAIIYNAFK